MPWPVAHGPDIAHYQNITGEPVDPAWRLFSHKCSEGANSGDATFPSRWKWMRTQGFRYRGAYHWLRSDSSVSAQAKNIIGRLDAQGGLELGEFVQSDWETTPNITVNTAEDEREFCDRIEQHYSRACTISYSSDWIPDSLNDPDTLSEFFEWLDLTQGEAPLWYANYNNNPLDRNGWQQECARYGADVCQFTSSFRHPSIVSKSGGGFDMNHVLRWETLDRIAGYGITELPDVTDPVIVTPPPEEEVDMKAILYTVTTPDAGGAWFYVSPERRVSTLGTVAEEKDVIAAGAIERTVTADDFRLQLPTMQPVGALTVPAQNVLGAEATADWDARATVARSPGSAGPIPNGRLETTLVWDQ